MTRLRHLLEAAAFWALQALARAAPRRALLVLGDLAGRLGFVVDRRHRRIALDNLRAALGSEAGDDALRTIALGAWRHFGRVTVDTLTFPRWSADDVGRRVTVEGLEHLRAAWSRGRGVLCISAHYGHWELAGLMQGHLGHPLVLVARPLDNPLLERMLRRLREGSGNKIVHKRNALREMIRACQRGLGVAVLIDQDARGEGVFVPFFDRLASTTPAVALLALRTGAPVIPCRALPEDGGRYRIVYEAEIPVESRGDLQADVVRVTAQCTAVIERWVRERPELWLWMHRRWKTRPPGDPGGGGSEGEPA